RLVYIGWRTFYQVRNWHRLTGRLSIISMMVQAILEDFHSHQRLVQADLNTFLHNKDWYMLIGRLSFTTKTGTSCLEDFPSQQRLVQADWKTLKDWHRLIRFSFTSDT
ncbi:hypothetical protein CHS0354_021590, partial [Potamilus streckersoni]